MPPWGSLGSVKIGVPCAWEASFHKTIISKKDFLMQLPNRTNDEGQRNIPGGERIPNLPHGHPQNHRGARGAMTMACGREGSPTAGHRATGGGSRDPSSTGCTANKWAAGTLVLFAGAWQGAFQQDATTAAGKPHAPTCQRHGGGSPSLYI